MSDAPAATSGGPTATALTDLLEFLGRAVGRGHRVEVAVPDDSRTRVCVWPVALLPDLGTRGGYGKQTLRLRARHLVTVDGTVGPALALLDKVLVATLDEDRFQLVLEPVPAGVWGTPGTPRPSVLIDVPVQLTATRPSSPRVTSELRLDGGGLRSITGRLLGPGDVPLPGMTVASPATSTSVITDTRGGFVLPGQPVDRAVLLHLSGRGLLLQVKVGPEATDPVVVHCPIEEV
ncbi:MAG TPA: hypothetical protein VKB69_05375 [Micromonosporaceae bacterium]|nr:hypothetical protein [Micromonosporaceae bacterium]